MHFLNFYHDKCRTIHLPIGLRCIRNGMLRSSFVQAVSSSHTSYGNSSHMKTSSIWEWAAISTLLSRAIKFSRFFYFLDTENLLRLPHHDSEGQYHRFRFSLIYQLLSHKSTSIQIERWVKKLDICICIFEKDLFYVNTLCSLLHITIILKYLIRTYIYILSEW